MSASRARRTGCVARLAISASTSAGGPRKSTGRAVRRPSAVTISAPKSSFGSFDRNIIPVAALSIWKMRAAGVSATSPFEPMDPPAALNRSDKVELSALFDPATGASKSKSARSVTVALAQGGGGGSDAIASSDALPREMILHNPLVIAVGFARGLIAPYLGIDR